LGTTVDPAVVGCLLDDDVARLEVHRGLIEHQVDLARQHHRIVDATRTMHQRVADGTAALRRLVAD
jgi:hypothetical protein